jgi:Zn-dependent peptidase ImmA (M78 family)/DNA-binding XRE family transcriptional regulator
MIYGERIVQARELALRTQIDFADALGVTRALLASYETGRVEPSEEFMERLCSAVDLPSTFFERPITEHFALGTLQFRARGDMTAKERNQAYQGARLLYEVYETVESRYDPIPYRLRTVSGDAEEAALETRSQLGIAPDVPIARLLHSFERVGVVVQALPFVLQKRDGFSGLASCGNSLRPVLTLPVGVPGDRQRLTAAHEIAEMVFDHRASGKDKETACNRFAGALLLPRSAMIREIRKPISLATFAMLKRRWGVSIQALVVRAYNLEIITKTQYYGLFQQIGKRGWRKREPAELDVPGERPRALRKMVETTYGDPIDVKRFAADARIGVTFAKRLLLAHAEAPGAPIAVIGNGNGALDLGKLRARRRRPALD